MSGLPPPDAPAARIGPGRLILVVGPSGAGKDTLIAGARAFYASDESVVFPRRIITRASTDFEAHDTISSDDFRNAADAGRFALWWEAHGHGYAIPLTINADLRARRTVVCNVSRAIIAEARERYADVRVVLVTAPPDVLAARLAARARGSDGDLARRLARSDGFAALAAECVITNVGAPDAGAAALIAAIAAARPPAEVRHSSASAS